VEAGVPRAPLERLLLRPATNGAPHEPRPWLEAFLRDALAGLRALHKALEAASLPDALDPLMENCIAFGKAYRQIERLLAKHDAIRRALLGPPATLPKTAPAPPAPAAPVSQPAPGVQRKSGALIAVVWEALQRHQPCTNAQVAQVTGEQRKHVHKALQSLVKQGKARKQGQTYAVVGTLGVERDA